MEAALAGSPASVTRISQRGELIVSVAVPIQRFRAVLGALLLSTQGGDIDAIVRAERIAIIRVFLFAATVTILLSILLAGAIAGPVRRLAAAADRVRRGSNSREEIPDFSDRQDEIGHLARAFREMTNALYNKIDAIEKFAADVAHELKNPLTSLRSAVETLPLAKTKASQDRLMEVIQHDVRRLDRLISDISDASRLDAELARIQSETIDLAELLRNMADAVNQRTGAEETKVKLTVADAPGQKPYQVQGHDIRLGQVISNLLDNARSFSPDEGTVRVDLAREGRSIRITVDDDGPGHPGGKHGAHIRTVLHRPSRRGRLRQQLRPWTVDFKADHRGAWRVDFRNQPERDGRRWRTDDCRGPLHHLPAGWNG